MFTEAQLRAISKYRHKAPDIIIEETEKDAFDDQTTNVNVWDPFLKLVVILDAKGRCVETRP